MKEEISYPTSLTLVGFECPKCNKFQFIFLKTQIFVCECGFESDLVVCEENEKESNEI